jgi:hypothetical protein
MRSRAALSVADAIGRWPELEEHAARLGSPAVANLDDGWLDQFMAHAERQHLRVDFIALHLYGPPKPEWFLKRIERMVIRPVAAARMRPG